MLIALEFMACDHLLEDRILVSFCDGESLLLNKTRVMFSFHKGLRVFLDWYHVDAVSGAFLSLIHI